MKTDLVRLKCYCFADWKVEGLLSENLPTTNFCWEYSIPVQERFSLFGHESLHSLYKLHSSQQISTYKASPPVIKHGNRKYPCLVRWFSNMFTYVHIFSCFKFPDAPFISFRDTGDSAGAIGAGDPTSHPVPLGGLHSRQRPGPGGDLFGFEGGAMMGTTGTTALALAQRVVPPGTLGGSYLHHVYVVWSSSHYKLLTHLLSLVVEFVGGCPRCSCFASTWSLISTYFYRKIYELKPFQRLSMTLEAAIAIRDAPNALEVAQFWRYSALLGGVPSHQFIQRPPGSNGMAECEC